MLISSSLCVRQNGCLPSLSRDEVEGCDEPGSGTDRHNLESYQQVIGSRQNGNRACVAGQLQRSSGNVAGAGTILELHSDTGF